MNCQERLSLITQGFQHNRKAFIALGDETRQLLLLTLLESDLQGIRVGEIAKKTHLTRPSVSHHLQILKEAGIVRMRKQGTMNFYYISEDETNWRQLAEFMTLIYDSISHMKHD